MPVRCGPFILSVVGAPYGEGIGGHHIIRITRGCPNGSMTSTMFCHGRICSMRDKKISFLVWLLNSLSAKVSW